MMTKEKDDVFNAKEVLPEAPFSVNFRGVTKTGWACQWTIRGLTEDDLVTNQTSFIKRLEAGGVVPLGKQPQGNGNGSQNTDVPDEDPGWCKIHDTKMFENENDRGKWWSHKTDDPAYSSGFCNGKPKK
jgi:hypothetical protein